MSLEPLDSEIGMVLIPSGVNFSSIFGHFLIEFGLGVGSLDTLIIVFLKKFMPSKMPFNIFLNIQSTL